MKQVKYKRWLLWSRFLMLIMVLQFVAATYLVFVVAKHLHLGRASSNCVLGHVSKGTTWQQNILVLLIIVVIFVATTQCFTGYDVLRWRSFYAREDNAWKTHYMEVFDHGIREAMCCLGRSKYLSVLEEDEVYSVAQLLGDLVTYRAAGTGHFELLAGLALFQSRGESPKSYERCLEAPEDRIQEATAYHPFAEAAYTGLLLDIGRNPVLFPCVWLYRQGILTPWTRNRCPILLGDNWWRGHAAAFLNYVNLPPEALRQGRVNQDDPYVNFPCEEFEYPLVDWKAICSLIQKGAHSFQESSHWSGGFTVRARPGWQDHRWLPLGKCEAAYFIVVLHQLKSVVIAVRGTETPEDLLTDGLCRECTLSIEDLDGLIKQVKCCNHIHPDVRQRVISSMPHYGHSGIVEAARNLFMQIDGNTGDDGKTLKLLHDTDANFPSTMILDLKGYADISSGSRGFLSLLLGAGCECNGYSVRIVGHSLGGAIAAMLGLRVSIVYNKEFSARLSVASIMRLRAAALTALSQETTDARITSKLARRFLFLSKYEKNKVGGKIEASHLTSSAMTTETTSRGQDQMFHVWPDVDAIATSYDETNHSDSLDDFTNPFYDASPVNENLPPDDPVSEFMDVVPSSVSGPARDVPEVFLPGLVIHIQPQKNSFQMPLSKWWRTTHEESSKYKAFIADRESFKDIIVSPSMFLDHLPWRCDHAMRGVLKARRAQKRDDGSQIV
ncbi:hypothetical protein RHMOL_Rhmol09G0045900 [Rhododendron molle]|uniref:Uncharacterized protein n=1 Tax=Rhododendron molle TaxID=49168 RepID=A0ACC0MAX6_RHOML|nr:hypothetical protein RHMOL_Rhmol09G0045900 [Rhododendron molle]